ncbi:TetR/AcrR family transcriptional regulator [Virgibacillus senegalensis]|uniref:TetR/AcrR family transcriptional regulator n=1 Tax=Virgibacillus senegalensis TaxID=1499679 RepID=UPI00069FF87A|nr:TetR/AcrR family transcriptional regulator [Virgibacillus senegalensis]
MKKSQKKEAILNVAEQLFYRCGFHAVGVKSILEEAGVAPMTMYYHFQSKEDLIKEILVRRENQYLQLIETNVKREDGINSYIKSLIKIHLNWIEKDSFNGCLFLRAKQEYEGINDEIASLTREHKKTLLNRIENDIEIFHVSRSLGVQLLIILEGLTSIAQIQPIDEVKEAANSLIKGIYEGIYDAGK